MKETLIISLGIMTDTIAKQLDGQGFKYNRKKVEEFEEWRDSLNQLYITGLVNDKELSSVKRKIFTRIKAHVVQQNKKNINR